MNYKEKIILYKERLGFTYFQELADAAGVPGSWLTKLVKKEELTVVDINHLLKLCAYLNITIEELINDEHEAFDQIKLDDIDNNDISIKIKEISQILDNEDVKLDGRILNNQAKQVCKDSLDVVISLIKQYL